MLPLYSRSWRYESRGRADYCTLLSKVSELQGSHCCCPCRSSKRGVSASLHSWMQR